MWAWMPILACSMLVICTKPDSTRQFLADQGYKQIEITGYRFFMKSENESCSTGFKAINPNGIHVSGLVTEGLVFRGKTIRFD
jgi:hypothetical protein